MAGDNFNSFIRNYLGSLFLIITPPIAIILIWYTNFTLHGSYRALYDVISEKGFVPFLREIWPTPFDPLAWKIIAGFASTELFLLRVIPGAKFTATRTQTGFQPVYKANGVPCYFISVFLFFTLAFTGIIKPAIVYDKFGELLSSMNLFSFFFCIFLSFKGLYFPSSKDNGTNGSVILDFYWGTELYPRIFGFDVKQFTNCRFGMMYWQIGILCYAWKQYELNGSVSDGMIVNVLLQSVYICKFYLWETGYLCSMDIQHDRAGYYICWGCLVFLPCLYTSHSFYLVQNKEYMSRSLSVIILSLGLIATYINYDADWQRQEYRRLHGHMMIWNRPAKGIAAKYLTKDGEEHISLLLYSGWWGVSRHFHYIPEIAASFFWSCPGLTSHVMPYSYTIFLTCLLMDRAVRDDIRCSKKYGRYWDEYKKQVPYKIVPFVV